ncbi:hypothetical protein B0H14DRAFT_3535851 [Mycena olivaceomarginata]|nr:hypothetical protein B0H14DRAFT_3535851 [Mycena olivaceomarginata]
MLIRPEEGRAQCPRAWLLPTLRGGTCVRRCSGHNTGGRTRRSADASVHICAGSYADWLRRLVELFFYYAIRHGCGTSLAEWNGMKTSRVLFKATDNGSTALHTSRGTIMAIRARDTVIFTPDLHEQTLAHLPMRDLLTIAPLFRGNMAGHHTLARSLFEHDTPITTPIENPLLAEPPPPSRVNLSDTMSL